MTADGNFLMLRGYFDRDKDVTITLKEFEDDGRGFRKAAMPTAPFSMFDLDGNGVYTVEEARTRAKQLHDAVDADNFEIVDAFLAKTAMVSIPKGWARDEFAQPPMWTFLSALTMPIGLFHGTDDNLTSVEGVRALEALAKKDGKTNMEFSYFGGLEHTLGIGAYFVRGTLPDGHQAIFQYIGKQTGKR
jgi:hypothetical protein